MKEAPKFLTTEEVLAILRVSRRTLQNYRTEGKIPFHKISHKTILYKEADIEKFLREQYSTELLRAKGRKLLTETIRKQWEKRL